MDKAIAILTVLAKNDETMDLSFCGGYVEICEALNELKSNKELIKEIQDELINKTNDFRELQDHSEKLANMCENYSIDIEEELKYM